MSQVGRESKRMSQIVQQTGEADALRQVTSCIRDKMEKKRWDWIMTRSHNKGNLEQMLRDERQVGFNVADYDSCGSMPHEVEKGDKR